jgi:glycosyltransferase involved in cell wall biosynthesis
MLRVGVVMYETSHSKGQELVAQRMVREFNRLGYEAYLITSAYHDWEPVITEEEIAKRGGYSHTFERELGIPVLRVGSEIAGWPPRRVLFRNFVGMLTQIVADLKLNVLITHSTLWNGPEDAIKFVVWNRHLAEEGGQNPAVVFCHMSHFQEASDERYTVEERTYREVWNRISLEEIMRQADYVIATTPLEEEQMKKLGADEGKFVLFPGGIDEDIFESSGSSAFFKLRTGIPRSAKLITCLGTVEERKNVLSVVEVAKRFAGDEGVHFVVAGRLNGEYAERVKAIAGGLGNLTLLGEITDEEKAQLIDASYLNITMSRSEALGIAQLEFMYRGVPVVTSGVGGQSWVVKSGLNGIVLKGPDDVEGAVSAVKDLVKNTKLRSKLSKGASKTSSPATLTYLVAGLSKKLLSKLSRAPGVTPLQEAKEKIVEARVHGGRMVSITTKRLIVSSARGGKLIVSVPYGEISRIVRFARRSWHVLLVGLVLSVAALAFEFLAPGPLRTVFGSLKSIPIAAGSSAYTAFEVLLPTAPLVASAIVYLARVKQGYVIQYGKKEKLFLEREFGRAIRMADSFSEKNLMTPEEPEAG